MTTPNHNPTANLARLPTELLREILLYNHVQRGYCAVAEAEDVRRTSNTKVIGSLHSLALTCRILYEFTTPFLYGSLVGIGGRNNWPRVIRYLQTIMAKPTLIKHLRYIETEISEHRGAGPYSQDLIDTFAQMEQHEYWATPMSKLSKPFDANFRHKDLLCVSYLIPLAHNLQSFGLHSWWRDVLCLSPRFNPRLQELSYCKKGDVATFRAPENSDSDYNAILMLFHRRRSALSARLWPGITSDQDETLPVMIDEMTFEGDWRIWRICEFPYVCESIRHFKCRWTGVEPLDLYTIRQYLVCAENTLETLELDTLDSEWLYSLKWDIPTFESLREFTVLKYLKITGMALWSHDESRDQPVLSSLLPASLETLVIETKWEKYVQDSLLALAEGCPTHLPKLKRIDCSWGPAPMLIGTRLIATFEKLGVTLDLSLVDTLEEKQSGTEEDATRLEKDEVVVEEDEEEEADPVDTEDEFPTSDD